MTLAIGIAGVILTIAAHATAITIPDNNKVTPVMISGRGCLPGGDVVVREGSMHATSAVIATLKADSRGHFRGQVPVEPEGDGTFVLAECEDASGALREVLYESVKLKPVKLKDYAVPPPN